MIQDDVRVSWVRINGQWIAVNSKEWVYDDVNRQWVPQKVEGFEWNETLRLWEPR